ncbi:MAG TPA: RimK/LysX family protein [Phycisphaerae bacterium]|nr:ATP-dependent zinc protease [Phycisphaerales bacterium]HRX83509.1 RimK/LysX family protein [Phycisphaerae bacterium]
MKVTARRHSTEPHIIGWREYVALPEWGIAHLEAKVDTGARTSALHVDNLARLPGERVKFDVVLSRKNPARRVPVVADIVRVTRVRSSTGHQQERFVVATTIRLGGLRRQIELSLVRREQMICRMLLGRKALVGFLVDVNRKHEHGRPQRRKRGGAS